MDLRDNIAYNLTSEVNITYNLTAGVNIAYNLIGEVAK